MKIHPIRSSMLAVAAAALIATPGFAAMHGAMQGSAQSRSFCSGNAQLTTPLNSKSAWMGQPVYAKLMTNVKAGTVELKDGTSLMGKVTKVSHINGTPSISVAFYRAVRQDGQVIPIQAIVLDTYPPYRALQNVSRRGSYLPPLPKNVAANKAVVQKLPGTLSGVTMHSSAQSKVSAVYQAKDKSFLLPASTWLQMAIRPEPGARRG